MIGSLFFLLFGDAILAVLFVLSGILREGAVDAPIDPDDSTLIKDADFMFPKDFLSRYPHEANAYRLKIFAYFAFNLLVKGYGSIDPEKVWSNYNREDYKRVLIDAVFYEYLANFTDSQNKDFVFNISESTRSHLPVSNEEIAVDRIGQYLDHLLETESKPKRLKGAYGIWPQTAECERLTIRSPGKPGIDYPNFCDIPDTYFSCDGKRIPGIYADFQTGCQVFHVCWHHRKDSFLCPIGTIFNQSLLTCDIWHATGCYSSPLFFDRDQFLIDGVSEALDVPEYDRNCASLLNKPLLLHTKFRPVKCYGIDMNEQDITNPDVEDASDFQLRLETAYDLAMDMLHMLGQIKRGLADGRENWETQWIRVIGSRIERSAPKPSTETSDETTEFTRELGETDFKPSTTAEQVHHSGKLLSGTKPDLSVTRSTLLKSSESLDAHLKSSTKQDVPEIVMGSLRLGGNILNEGIPLTKQVIIDSYRKIASKKP